jgi:type IV secretory pathway TrbF-like protein
MNDYNDSYAEAQQVYRDRFANLAAAGYRWQLAALGLGVLLALSLAVNFRQAGAAKQIPYVVMTDRLGYALTLPRPLSASDSLTLEQIERYEVAAFIRAVRTVVTDPVDQQQFIDFMNSRVRGKATHTLSAYLNDGEHSPFLIARHYSITPAITSLIPMDKAHTFEVRWTETYHDTTGAPARDMAPTHWIAWVETQVHPRANNPVLVNPLGFVVTDIRWTPDGQAEAQR